MFAPEMACVDTKPLHWNGTFMVALVHRWQSGYLCDSQELTAITKLQATGSNPSAIFCAFLSLCELSSYFNEWDSQAEKERDPQKQQQLFAGA